MSGAAGECKNTRGGKAEVGSHACMRWRDARGGAGDTHAPCHQSSACVPWSVTSTSWFAVRGKCPGRSDAYVWIARATTPNGRRLNCARSSPRVLRSSGSHDTRRDPGPDDGRDAGVEGGRLASPAPRAGLGLRKIPRGAADIVVRAGQ